MMKTIFHVSFAALLLLTDIPLQAQTGPVPVIFDTDMGNDVDDVLALSMLYTYHKARRADLKAVTISKGHPYAVTFTDLMNRTYGLGHIPLGYVGNNGPTPEPGRYNMQTVKYTEEGRPFFTYDSTLAEKVPEAYKLQRKVLAASPDTSVVMVVVGFSTNIARLLQSGADEFSPLGGRALVAKKVKALYMMAGMFGPQPFPEYNVVKDIAAARTVFEQWPGRIIASGWEVGSRLHFRARSLSYYYPQLWEHPLVNAYFHYMKMPYNRETWDLTSVLHAIEPERRYFRESAPGTIRIEADGKSVFTESAGGNHRIMLLEEAKIKPVLKRFEETAGGIYGKY
ncbi:nucleoside hydrolase [Chitinophaga alhagiae]|uniref:nucleoside hydrolase n=1 Tax=Chitinophaga alhagiae TaxID=2203219 RepID=UPI000E5BE5CB|nr:nucleoside hydrolase [Chitinophaga alhagiae]